MKTKRGSTLLIVLLIALFVVGAVAVLAISGFGVGQNLFTKRGVSEPVVSESSGELQSSSDEIGDIEKDINETDVEGLDEGMSEVNNDLNSL